MLRRMVVLVMLGFASGLPLGLTGSTFQAWMTKEHIDLGAIGLFGLVGIPYSLKFLWAPLIDRIMPPFLGRRRGWLLITQAWLVAMILWLGQSNPAEHLRIAAVFALLTAFFSASQDIVTDAYRTDLLTEQEAGLGSSMHVMGYRGAMIFSTALALILADHIAWRYVYAIMAAAMTIGLVATLLAPEPVAATRPPRTFAEAFSQPLLEFFSRRGAVEVVFFTLFYKLDAVMTIALSTAFMLGLGFSLTEVGTVNKAFGLTATLLGTFAGGALMLRLSLKRSLWVFGVIQAFAGLSYLMLSLAGRSHGLLILAVAVENACSGMGNAAYAAFFMHMCDRRYSATQYALLSSLMAVTRTVFAAPAGFLVQKLGWPEYYVFCIFASAPAFLLLTRYDRWERGRLS